MAILKDGIYKKFPSKQPDFWLSVLDRLRKTIGSDQFQAWVEPLSVVSFNKTTLTLSVPNEFFKTYVKNNLEKKIFSVVETVTGNRLSIIYSTEKSTTSKSKPVTPYKESRASSSLDNEQDFSSLVSSSGLIKTRGQPVDTRYSFDNFIIGSGNQFAYFASQGVVSNPHGKHNPLLIYGNSGLGKTHLLHAIAVETLKKNPKAKICYVTAEQFVVDFIDATKKQTQSDFKNRYRSKFDLFLIDDIQFLGGKTRSQEELFYTFNYLCESHFQVIVTSDQPPSELVGLEPRLISRLQQGLVADIKFPDLETRISILRAKAEQDDLYLPDDVCHTIASNIKNNIRELEGSLTRLEAEASINGTEITLETTKEILSELFHHNQKKMTSVLSIKDGVCEYFKISPSDLDSRSRARKYSKPRQIAMYLIRKHGEKTLSEIASFFGGKDHSTVIYAIRKIEKEKESDSELSHSIESIQNKLQL